MQTFTKVIDDIQFEFTGSMEGKDEICRVRTEFQEFKMTVGEDGNWRILQQVPIWIKQLEGELGKTIDEVYS